MTKEKIEELITTLRVEHARYNAMSLHAGALHDAAEKAREEASAQSYVVRAAKQELVNSVLAVEAS